MERDGGRASGARQRMSLKGIQEFWSIADSSPHSRHD